MSTATCLSIASLAARLAPAGERVTNAARAGLVIGRPLAARAPGGTVMV